MLEKKENKHRRIYFRTFPSIFSFTGSIKLKQKAFFPTVISFNSRVEQQMRISPMTFRRLAPAAFAQPPWIWPNGCD
jgi:hypothetical protein